MRKRLKAKSCFYLIYFLLLLLLLVIFPPSLSFSLPQPSFEYSTRYRKKGGRKKERYKTRKKREKGVKEHERESKGYGCNLSTHKGINTDRLELLRAVFPRLTSANSACNLLLSISTFPSLSFSFSFPSPSVSGSFIPKRTSRGT